VGAGVGTLKLARFMDRESGSIHQALVRAWQNVKMTIERLHGSATVKPNDLQEVLQVMDRSDERLIWFEVRPIVFQLPERGDASSTDLFVVVSGCLAFDRAAFRERRLLLTRSFSTEVGYFRHAGTTLKHVYGAHYDFALDEVGHPVFHGQMKSFRDFATHIAERYRVTHDVDDLVIGILKTVRVPSAQLDIFSVFLQLCADHLLHNESSTEDLAAFNDLLEKSAFCRGAAYQVPRLMEEEARQCYRALHWYSPIV